MSTTRDTLDSKAMPSPASGSPGLRRGGILCALGGAIAGAGATITAAMDGTVSADVVSYPYSADLFGLTQGIWAVTHLLILVGVIALAGSGLAGRSPLARVGLRLAIWGTALMAPAELSFAFIASRADDSTVSVILGTAIGLAALVSAIGLLLTGIAVLRTRVWAGWGRFAPLLCGVFVPVVLIPVQAIRPALFLWPIAGWNACFVLLGAALIVAARQTSAAGTQQLSGTQLTGP